MELAVVLTTINVPVLFEAWCQDFVQHGRKDLGFIVIGDLKTASDAEALCQTLQAKYDFPFEYYDVERQKSYLKRFPELDAYLPYNCVQRRNIGMLRAYELGAKALLTVDDDNYLLESDLLKNHLRVGKVSSLPSFHSTDGWFDPCQFLSTTPDIRVYHRGFPMSRRWQSPEIVECARTGRVVANVGMWLGDPDVDAWVRMTLPVEASRWNRTGNFTLEPGTWAPFNSQQTTIVRELVPAYFLNPNVGRYDDIWASYIIHRLSQRFGDMVSYGSPIVNHLQTRSLGSLWRDLTDERMGILLNDSFIEILRETSLAGNSYEDCYIELTGQLKSQLATKTIKVPGGVEYLAEYARGMEMWTKTIRRLGAGAVRLAETAA